MLHFQSLIPSLILTLSDPSMYVFYQKKQALCIDTEGHHVGLLYKCIFTDSNQTRTIYTNRCKRTKGGVV